MNSSRYFIYLAYKGTNYSGWQVQPGEKTIQGELENAISTLLKKEIKVTGAGRTDTGVHASYFVAHFDSEKIEYSLNDLVYKLNRFLPIDIAISDIRLVKPESHARFDAISRTYRYIISKVKDPFSIALSTYLNGNLDIESMNIASSYMLDYIDFTSFSKIHTEVKTNNCRINYARWTETETRIVFEIKADRFLRNMVRAIVGTHLDIGRGKIPPEEIKSIIELKERSAAGTSVPPEGLFLINIEYPVEIFV